MTIILNDARAIPSNKFTYSNGMFASEISTLGAKAGPFRIYDDACDVGLAVKSCRTGRVVRYYLSETNRSDADGDVTDWRFLPIDEDARCDPAIARTSVTLFND
jgi:hypothetical protein